MEATAASGNAFARCRRTAMNTRTQAEEPAMRRTLWTCLLLTALATGTAQAEGKNPMVLISTSMGDIKVELDEQKAPVTVKNFLGYVNDKYYDGTIFHRVIPNFMIQGGGMDKDMKEKATKAPIKNEAGNGLKNSVGTLAMARTNVVDSATGQFFINVKDNVFLDHRDETQAGFGYAVFGKVVDGMDVVHKIENVPTGNKGMHQNVPTEPVIIKSITVIK
jgi:cyclophilin family peptidyl-prolyl cis-trans isomerase